MRQQKTKFNKSILLNLPRFFYLSCFFMASSPPFLSSLSLDALTSALPSQAFKLGTTMVSCGEVAGIQIAETKEN